MNLPHTEITEAQGEHSENWVTQGFLWDECDSCISPENVGFDGRWVRFPKHISLFSALSQLESGGLGDSPDWVQMVASGKDEFPLVFWMILSDTFRSPCS